MKIALISMPFVRVDYPSFALTQMKSVLKKSKMGSIPIFYLNHDLAANMDFLLYEKLCGKSIYLDYNTPYQTPKYNNKNDFYYAGDWLFRNLIFPMEKDNSVEYFGKFFKKRDDISNQLIELREGLDKFLQNCIEKYSLLEFDILCFTSMFHQHAATLAMILKLKQQNPELIIILGGSNIDEDNAIILKEKFKEIDYIYYGGIKNLTGFITKCKKQKQKFNDDPQIIFGEENDINDVIDLDYDDYLKSLQQKLSHLNIKPMLFLETSRGCWWGENKKCTFCDYNNMNFTYRKMNHTNAIKYLQDTIDRYKDRCQHFWAVDAIISKEYTDEVFNHINTDNGIKIFYEITPQLNSDQIKKIVDCGITICQAGIESFDTDTLKKMKKCNTLQSNISFLKNCTIYGISLLWNLLAGIPFESIDRYKAMLEIIPKLSHLYPPTGLWPISYDKYSDYVVNSQKHNLRLAPYTAVLKYIYPYKDSELEKISYFYQNSDINNILSDEKIRYIEKINLLITKWQKKWFLKNSVFPLLYIFQQNGVQYIYDSRNGSEKKEALTNKKYELLYYLDKAKHYSQIKNKYDYNDLKDMIDQGYIIQEKNIYISCVTNQKPKHSNLDEMIPRWIWR